MAYLIFLDMPEINYTIYVTENLEMDFIVD